MLCVIASALGPSIILNTCLENPLFANVSSMNINVTAVESVKKLLGCIHLPKGLLSYKLMKNIKN